MIDSNNKLCSGTNKTTLGSSTKSFNENVDLSNGTKNRKKKQKNDNNETKKRQKKKDNNKNDVGDEEEEEKEEGETNVEEDNLDNVDEAIQVLLQHHIADNRKVLRESWVNLDKIADYCEANYFQNDDKKASLDETKNYTTRALASVSNQIHSFASNFSTLLDLQMNSLNEVETRLNGMVSKTRFNEEKSSRREIGLLTKPKVIASQPKIVKPLYPERSKRPVSYVREPIDYTILDQIGQANQIYERASQNAGIGYGHAGLNRWIPGQVKSATLRPSKSSNLSMMMNSSNNAHLLGSGSDTLNSNHNHNTGSNPSAGNSTSGSTSASHYRTPAPTARPPTPPLSGTMRFSSLSRTSKDYRSLHGGVVPPPIVAPPQLPTNYGTMTGTRSAHATSNNPNGNTTTVPPNNSTITTTTTTTLAGETAKVSFQIPVSTSNNNAAATSASANNSACAISKTSNQYDHYRSGQTTVVPPAAQPPHHPHFHHHTNPFVQQPISNVNNTGGADVRSNLPPPSSSSSSSLVAKQQVELSTTPTNNNPNNLIPQSYIEKVVALYDYSADKDDELSFQENSIIYVIQKNDDGWWEGVLNGITGLFPGNYVAPSIL